MERRLITRLPLRRGRHDRPEDGMCAMEVVAWLAGEPHSDDPECACPVLAAVVRAVNDRMPGRLRDPLLRPLLPRLVASRVDRCGERRRALRLVDATVRRIVPAVLERRGLVTAAGALRELEPLVSGAEALAGARRACGSTPGVPRCVRWLLVRACSADDPASWIAAVAHLPGELGDARLWEEIVREVGGVLAVNQPGSTRAASSPRAWRSASSR